MFMFNVDPVLEKNKCPPYYLDTVLFAVVGLSLTCPSYR